MLGKEIDRRDTVFTVTSCWMADHRGNEVIPDAESIRTIQEIALEFTGNGEDLYIAFSKEGFEWPSVAPLLVYRSLVQQIIIDCAAANPAHHALSVTIPEELPADAPASVSTHIKRFFNGSWKEYRERLLMDGMGNLLRFPEGIPSGLPEGLVALGYKVEIFD